MKIIFTGFNCLSRIAIYLVIINGFVSAQDPILHKFVVADEGFNQVHLIDQADPVGNWTVDTPDGNRDMQLIGNGLVLVTKNNAGGWYEIDLETGSIVNEVDHGFGKTFLIRRKPDGNTVVGGENIQGKSGLVILELDASQAIVREVNFPDYPTIRTIRLTPDDNILFGSNKKAVMGDWEGGIIWEVDIPIQKSYGVYQILHLSSGIKYISAGYEPLIYKLDADNEVVGTFDVSDHPEASDMRLNFYGGIQMLKNGNLVVTNWQGHNASGLTGHQMLEFDAEGELVWSLGLQQEPVVYSSIHHAIILDGLDTEKMHGEMNGVLSPVFGCMDPEAPNYDSLAVESDDSCEAVWVKHLLQSPAHNQDLSPAWDILGRSTGPGSNPKQSEYLKIK